MQRPRSRAAAESPAIAARVLIALVRLYQVSISPLIGPACRFQPSCSSYAIASIELHGPLKGSARALQRLARCHPLGGGGLDLP